MRTVRAKDSLRAANSVFYRRREVIQNLQMRLAVVKESLPCLLPFLVHLFASPPSASRS